MMFTRTSIVDPVLHGAGDFLHGQSFDGLFTLSLAVPHKRINYDWKTIQ